MILFETCASMVFVAFYVVENLANISEYTLLLGKYCATLIRNTRLYQLCTQLLGASLLYVYILTFSI